MPFSLTLTVTGAFAAFGFTGRLTRGLNASASGHSISPVFIVQSS
jgi:hypothetical protein